jgi:hypothetical protein
MYLFLVQRATALLLWQLENLLAVPSAHDSVSAWSKNDFRRSIIADDAFAMMTLVIKR